MGKFKSGTVRNVVGQTTSRTRSIMSSATFLMRTRVGKQSKYGSRKGMATPGVKFNTKLGGK